MALTNLPTISLTLALISGSMYAFAPNQVQKKTATNQPQKKTTTNQPQKKATAQPAKESYEAREAREKQEKLALRKKYISFEVKDLEITEIHSPEPQFDTISFAFTAKVENISDIRIDEFNACVYLILPSGKECMINILNSFELLYSRSQRLEPQDTFEKRVLPPMGGLLKIQKDYKYYKADPTKPTLEEVQTAIKDNTYKLRVDCTELTTFNGEKREYL
ncbi:MAG: hypothetical protein LBH03_03785 [Holophagales bacterium]|jgi:hypothetical protein|nr:hypothetical protein [Holophagales bacterium]